MSKIIVLVGVAGSGKSTWAFNYVKENTNTVIISRDSLRKSLFGYNDINLNEYYLTEITHSENIISEFVDSMVRKAIKLEKDVIIDNTNLQPQYITHFKNFGVPISLRFFDGFIEEIYKMDAGRDKSVGKEVIDRQYRQFCKMKRNEVVKDIEHHNTVLESLMVSASNQHNEALRECVVVDIDGTVAHSNGRSPFDYMNVINDHVFAEVRTIVNSIYKNGIHIIFCTGRENVCLAQTEQWLRTNQFNWDELYMRERGDHRKDLIVKAEMWEKIQKDYDIIGMIDDRTQVVDFARRLGFKVYQCNEGDF